MPVQKTKQAVEPRELVQAKRYNFLAFAKGRRDQYSFKITVTYLLMDYGNTVVSVIDTANK